LLSPDWVIEGYLAGISTFHYVVVSGLQDGTVAKYQIHKGLTPVIDLTARHLLEDEHQAVHDALSEIIAPFRAWVMSNHFNSPKV